MKKEKRIELNFYRRSPPLKRKGEALTIVADWKERNENLYNLFYIDKGGTIYKLKDICQLLKRK